VRLIFLLYLQKEIWSNKVWRKNNMQTKTIIRSLLSASFFAALTFFLVAGAQAQVFTDIHDFNNTNGATPVAKLIFDSAGNLYGTATMSAQGGENCFGGCGVAFKLAREGSGWKELALHGFSGGADGGIPMGNLVFDAAGNLYGTAKIGGNTAACINSATNTKGCGVVFELSPHSGGAWTATTLYAFAGGADGEYPEGGLVFDAAGNLYGTTNAGGSLTACSGLGCGTVFELSPSSSGWTETIVHSFVDDGADGVTGVGSVIFDGAGNLYGATVNGGIHGFGSVFELSPSSSGWTETILHSFDQRDGFMPNGDLLFDSAGNLYGSTQSGGRVSMCGIGCGAVFELSPNSSGGWDDTTVTAAVQNYDGEDIIGISADASGNLYFVASQAGGGTTICGGQACGTVTKLTHTSTGWFPTVVHHFLGIKDDAQPNAPVAIDASGTLFGTTYHDGPLGYGMVYKIVP
jgi:uncharacterized repeat protein (TIGR03803 family)